MIERHWTGISRREEAEHYIEHLMTETIPQLKELGGFVRASILTRRVEKGTEFLIVTVWASPNIMRL